MIDRSLTLSLSCRNQFCLPPVNMLQSLRSMLSFYVDTSQHDIVTFRSFFMK